MKTIQTTIITAIILLTTTLGFAQEADKGKYSPEQKEKIEALKVSFLTEKMNLTPEEAQKFWPVYNKYKEERKALKQDMRENKGEKPDFNTMSDQDLNNMMEQKFVREQKELDLKKKYLAEFKKVLPVKKVALLYQAEDEFKKHLLQQAQKPHQPQQEERMPPKKN
jgi:hypothetical protein